MAKSPCTGFQDSNLTLFTCCVLCVCMCVLLGCCSEVPANSPARCGESIWCQASQVSLSLNSQTERYAHTSTLSLVLFGHTYRENIWVFSPHVSHLAFIQWPLFFYFLPYSIVVKPYLLYQVIKIPSNWRGHKDKHSNTLCFSSMCPWVKWQF